VCHEHFSSLYMEEWESTVPIKHNNAIKKFITATKSNQSS
jgi:hypothetical protein